MSYDVVCWAFCISPASEWYLPSTGNPELDGKMPLMILARVTGVTLEERVCIQYCLHLLTRKNMKKHSAKMMCKDVQRCAKPFPLALWFCVNMWHQLAANVPVMLVPWPEGKKKTWRWFQTEVHQIHNLLVKGTSVHLRLKNNSIPQNLPVVWEAGHCSTSVSRL